MARIQIYSALLFVLAAYLVGECVGYSPTSTRFDFGANERARSRSSNAFGSGDGSNDDDEDKSRLLDNYNGGNGRGGEAGSRTRNSFFVIRKTVETLCFINPALLQSASCLSLLPVS
jgi:hypothetical protein